jgi:APA family basic amino acid/polyamine antiporter
MPGEAEAQTVGSSGALARQLTLPAAVALVVGQVIAVGIFLTPGSMIRTVASPAWILAVWLVMGAMAVCGALCYGALAARFPQAGGGYVYLREAYGRRLAFLYGWKCFLVMDPGITAALAAGFASYAGYIVPLGPLATRLVGIAAIVVFGAIHVAGVRPGARVLATLSVLKVSLVVVLVVAALASAGGDWRHFLPFAARPTTAVPLGAALAGALVAAFFSFGGWWEVTKIAGEVRDPARTLPRALWMGIAVVTLVYVVVTLAFIYAIPIERVAASQAFVAQAGEVMFGAAGGRIVATVVVVCVLGSLGAMMMFAPRLYFAMATDGLFPSAAAALHPRFGTPARAIVIQAALASILVAVGTFETIVAYFVFITVAFIALTVASVFRLRRRGALDVPGFPWTPAIFLLLVAVLLVLLGSSNPLQAFLGVAIVAGGVPVYAVLGRLGANGAVSAPSRRRPVRSEPSAR